MDVETILSNTSPALLQKAAAESPGRGHIDLTRAGQLDITRDTYLEAEARGLTLTELLETDDYDPSPYESPLDAFERQLAVHGVRVGGSNPVSVELFYRGAPALLPEFMLREIRRGQQMRPELNNLVGSSSRVQGNRYTPFDVNATATDTRWSMRPVGDGANVPALLVTERLHSIDVPDYGLALKASYKALRHRTTTQFKVLLWYIGYRMQVDKLALLVDVLINGDGNSNPAEVIDTAVSGTLDYADLVSFWSDLHPFEMNTLICSKDKITTILTMSEFKDPTAGFRFQSTGELVSPLGSQLVRSDAVDSDLLIGIDKRFAAEEVLTQPLTVEYDKIIEQKFEEAVISESVAYAKVIPDAAKVLDVVWT
ncbi:MAG: hypothetical protein GF341_02125 [candidate division Zixibacteria bacterium]|nr:hypothetical protein [candidate division Zixibacteria bacterium]